MIRITINNKLFSLFVEGPGRRFTRCEAFEFLYSMITGSDDGLYKTSCNRLAKVWRWDNHLVRDFLDRLINLRIVSEVRKPASIILAFTDEFIDASERLKPLFSLLAMRVKKAGKADAFFCILGKIRQKEEDKSVHISYRSLAEELGWSHHTVYSFLNIMERNGIISKSPSADGNTFELGWADNVNICI